MKTWIARRKWLIYIAICLLAVLSYSHGYAWNFQISTESGRQRTVHSIWGVPIREEEPTDNIISEWVGPGAQDGKWVSVARGPHGFFLFVTYAYPRVFRHFSHLDSFVTDSVERQNYATFVLLQLRERENIRSVARECYDISDSVWDFMLERDVEDEPLTCAELVAQWNDKTGHNKIR